MVTASNGEEGLDTFHNEKPDMAILDIMMPIMDGLELCRKIRSESNIPILMLTAKKEDSDKI